MSSDIGACRFENGDVLFFVYDGTVDVCRARLHESIEDAWRELDTRDQLTPPTVDDAEPVEVAVGYGSGMRWMATASRSAMQLLSDRNPYDDERGPIFDRGLPDWAAAHPQLRV